MLGQAAVQLHHLVTEQLRCTISRRKAKIVAADQEVGRKLKTAAARFIGGTTAPSAPNLGTDYSAGRQRSRGGKMRMSATRLRRGLRRRKRLQRIAAAIGPKALKVFVTGTLAGIAYVSEVHGMADRELRCVDRLAAVTMRPRAKGRSLNTLMAAAGAPTWRAGASPILHYTRAVWRAVATTATCNRADPMLPELRAAWEGLDRDHLIEPRRRAAGGEGDDTNAPDRRRWDRVRGPLGALHLSLHRIGWDMKGPFTIRNDKNDGAEDPRPLPRHVGRSCPQGRRPTLRA